MREPEFLLVSKWLQENDDIVFGSLFVAWLKVAYKLIPGDIFVQSLFFLTAKKSFYLDTFKYSS